MKTLWLRVHALSPGGVATDMATQMRPDLDTSGLIQAEDMAELVVFLLTHSSTSMIDEVKVRRKAGKPFA